jgi:hypothetical protein
MLVAVHLAALLAIVGAASRLAPAQAEASTAAAAT